MPNHSQVIPILVIPWMAAFDVVDLGLQRRFFGGIVGLHSYQLRVIRRIGGAGNNRTNSLAQYRAGGHGIEQHTDHQEDGTHHKEPFFMAHDKRARLLGLLLDRLGGLAGLLGCAGGVSGSLTGALGGSVFLLDGLLLLPAGNGVAGKLGVLPQ